MPLRPISPEDARRLTQSGEAVLIDVREPAEHARERIAGAQSLPLSRFDAAATPQAHDRVAVFHCQSGARTRANAARLVTLDCREAYYLDGGLDAWKRAGLPTIEDRSAPIELQRQVMIAAGSLVLLGLILSVSVSPWFAGLSAFVGAGLVFAGVTGFCGMARLLMLMPWNRVA
jgi:rhodanese-related sulfurtransferase